ncbi:MAG TPA: hypothetical protein VHE81_16960 [Lacipirellulaceae bacterium]|nr:hypothetical protein [Lacipirellulaceae bacterium]
MNVLHWPVLRHFLFAICLIAILEQVNALARKGYAQPARAIDEARAQSVGIRKLESDHLVLYTDVPSSSAVESLPAIFDKAIPQWLSYFGVKKGEAANWRARAYLIKDQRRFAKLSLLPNGHESFANGITFGAEIWLRDQPTEYYRRHLLLHEGTHAFMNTFLGGCGPGWYMEGIAELLGTHRFDPKTGKLTLGIMPRNRNEVPMWGRIKLINDAKAHHRVLSLPAILQFDSRMQLDDEAYAWCWALVKLLDSHPRYRERFRQLYNSVQKQNFNEVFRREFAADWNDLNAEWQAYIASLDYGFDFDRMAIDFHKGEPLADHSHTTTVAADRGWQSSGAWLDAGKSYDITATGRYQIAAEQVGDESKSWPCEPGGITIDYHDGRPLGMLLGAIDSRVQQSGEADGTFAEPIAIGSHAAVKPAASGTLYFRVNDSAAKLDDNRGTLSVRIEPRH